MTTRQQFAFLVHFRTDIRYELGLYWPPFRIVPGPVLEEAVTRLPLPPVVWSTAHFSDQPDTPAGWVVLVPSIARQMLDLGQSMRSVLARIDQAVDKSVELGAKVLGLGALTAPVTRGGQRLTHRTDIGVTNGNAFTALMTLEGVKKLLPMCASREPHIAVIGATGSVGGCLVQLLAKQRTVPRLTLVARHQGRLDALATQARALGPDVDIVATSNMEQVRQADLVVLLTSSTEALLRSEHLKPGAIVLDDTQPRNTDPTLQKERPDVLIVDGGLVAMPGMKLNVSISLPDGYAYACLAETMLLALDGYDGHFSIGVPKIEQVEYVAGLAQKYRHLGFKLGPLHSFGHPLTERRLFGLKQEMAQ